MEEEKLDIEKALKLLREVQQLEKEAVERYTDHIEKINNPEINSMLEGFKRSEARHYAEITEKINALKEKYDIED
jgi:rubrerythrin